MEVRIFDYRDYKKFISDKVESLPNRGRGQYRKLSEYLNVNTVVISQIFKGKRELSLEQAYLITTYFGMSELEKEFFINLVQKDKANHPELKAYFTKKLTSIKNEAQKVKNVIESKELTDEAKFKFYSNWYYSAIRLSTLLPGRDNVQTIAHHLDISPARTREVVDFLLEYGLLKEEKGILKIGPQRTHLSEDNPYVSRHHTNWRLKGLENMESLNSSEIFYTSPMTVSQSVMDELKVMILNFITEMSKKVRDAKDEKLVCLNLDFFEVE